VFINFQHPSNVSARTAGHCSSATSGEVSEDVPCGASAINKALRSRDSVSREETLGDDSAVSLSNMIRESLAEACYAG